MQCMAPKSNNSQGERELALNECWEGRVWWPQQRTPIKRRRNESSNGNGKGSSDPPCDGEIQGCPSAMGKYDLIINIP